MVKFIALSGTTDVTENFYVYETEKDLIVVDCGVGFPEPDMLGVDLVIPDFSYVIERKNKLRGILITHGHEDHIGALPFLIEKVRTPIFSTRLVAGFIGLKMQDYGVVNFKINVFDPERDSITLGDFRISPFRTSHSIPDSVGFVIDTPEGKIVHAADYKFDWTPVDNKPFDVSRLSLLCANGVLATLSDCLGATTPGYTESERKIESRIENIVSEAKGRVFFTTISSNISRIRQALNVAAKTGRKVVIVGKSIDSKVKVANQLGYLDFPVRIEKSIKDLEKLPDNKAMVIISGSYGQPGSSLYRLALGEHDRLKLKEGDVVIFSSDPAPPGSKANVDFVVDRLIENGALVHYYDIQEDLHVSGHGSQEDIKLLLSLTKPKFVIPIGGTIRHMRAFSDLAQSVGIKKDAVFELKEGESVVFENGNAVKGGRVETRNVLVDGLGIGDVGDVVLRDRNVLAREGVVIILLQFDSSKKRLINRPEVISRGFVFEKRQKRLLEKAASGFLVFLKDRVDLDRKSLKALAIDFFERYFFEKTGRRPMVLPLVVEI